MELAADRPQSERRVSLPVVTWAAFNDALDRLAREPLRYPLDVESLGLSLSTTKQVRQTFQTLGLLSNDPTAQFRLRRLVTKRDLSVVVESLKQRFPDLVDAIAAGAPPHEVQLHLDGLSDRQSSRQRFGRFLYRLLRANDFDVEVYKDALCGKRDAQPHTSQPSTSVPESGAREPAEVESPSPGSTSDGSPWEGILQQEADLYLGRLAVVLDSDQFDAAGLISARLAALRKELRNAEGWTPSIDGRVAD